MTTLSAPARATRPLLLVLAALLLGVFLAVASPAQPVAASCGGTTFVSNQAELNAAIAAFNAETTPACVFTIQLSADIGLTASTTTINNATSGVSLVIEGGGYAVDGQDIAGVRPFQIAANTTVTMNRLTVTGGNITGVTNGGGISNGGNLTIINSTITGNTSEEPGGGIANTGTLFIGSSTISDNTATDSVGAGGGIYAAGGNVTIRNSTVSGNSSPDAGAGVYNLASTVSIESTTIASNTSGYYGTVANQGTTIRNSILANNGTEDCATSPSGQPVTDGGHNLVETQGSADTCGFVNGTNNNIVGVDPLLGPLAYNGGETETHALLAGSPALDAGDTTLTTDQRGITRPQGAADDIGAFEVISCTAFPLAAANEAYLNAAIGCYNQQTTPGAYTINITQDIDLTASTTVINNAASGVSLVIEGDGFVVDGQDTAGVRRFQIAANTTVTMNRLTVTNGNPGSPGGGIQNSGRLTLRDSSVTSSTGFAAGGGIHVGQNATVTINNSTISGNSVAGGGASGGGIFLDINAEATISNSTISGNTARSGGGIYSNEGRLTLDSVTITANTAPVRGAGLATEYLSSLAVIRNTILAGNLGSADCHQLNGTVTDGGHNLVQTQASGSNSCGFVDGVNGTILGQAPALGPLADNGGETETHALLDGSPAIDAGDTILATDQRGVNRPQGAADDIGAFETGTFNLTIVKAAVGGDDTFDFGTTANSDIAFADFSLTTVGGTAQTTLTALPAGFLEIEESAPAGWELTDAECVGVTGDDWSFIGAGRVRVTASPGDDVTCTFTNTNDPFNLTIVKAAVGGDDTFAFGSTINSDINLPGFSLTTVGGTAQTTPTALPAGFLEIEESAPAGWELTDAECVGVTGDDWSFIGAGRVRVTASPGDDVTCTFTNTNDPFNLTIVKAAVGGDDTFAFGSTINSDINLPGFSLTTVGGTAQTTPTALPAGFLEIEESAPAGWELTDAECVGVTGDDWSFIGAGRVRVTASPGDDVTCTFTNTNDPFNLTIVKAAVGGDDTFAFGSTINSDINLPGFSLTTVGGTAQTTPTALPAGFLEIEESAPAGWELTDAECVGVTGDDWSFIGAGRVRVTASPGDDVTCTFTNTNDPFNLTIVKAAVGGDDTFAFGSTINSDINLPGFSLTTVGGTAQTTPTALPAGFLEIEESAPAGWELTDAECVGVTGDDWSFIGAGRVRVTASPGDDVTCTFTNTNDPFNLTIVKAAVGGDDTFAFGSTINSDINLPGFSLTTVGGTAQTTPTALPAGFLEIEESAPAGWELTDAECVGVTGDDWSFIGAGRVRVTASPGDDVTCTFTNTNDPFNLTIVKAAVGGDDTFAFGSTINSDINLPGFSLTTVGGTAQTTPTALPAGFLEIEESAPAGWELTDAECVGVTGDDWSFIGAGRVRVTASPGDDVTCTFTNTNDPLAVTLAGFNAQAQAGHVLVTWETVSELDNAGFNLYRTGTPQAPTAADLLASVPSQGPGSAQGSAYSYPDYAVTDGEAYWYWLEDVDFNGATTMHGPVSVVFVSPTAVTLSGLEAAADRPAPVWPWLLAVIAAGLAATLAIGRRRHSSAA